jgi:NAD(P)H-hydrate epimerase
MENADQRWCIRSVSSFKSGAGVTILAGTGGNGGDGMVAARHLASLVFEEADSLGTPAGIARKDVEENWKTLGSMAESVQIRVVNDSSLLPRIEGGEL